MGQVLAKFFLGNGLRKILLILFLVVLFRFVLTGIFGQAHYARIFILLPVLFIFVSSLIKVITQKSYPKLNKLGRFLLVLNIWVGLTFIYHVFIAHFDFKMNLLPRLSSSLYVLVVPLGLYILDLKKKDLIYILDRATVWVLLLGGGISTLLFILKKGWNIGTTKLSAWIFPANIMEMYGNSYHYIEDGRTLGFMVVLEHSAAVISASALYWFAKTLNDENGLKENKPKWALFFWGLLCVQLMTTITVTAMTALTLLIVGLLSRKRKKIATFVFIFSPIYLALIYFNSQAWGKLENYLKHWKHYLGLFNPTLSGCEVPNIILAPFSNAAYNDGCSFHEIHGLSTITEFGLLPMLPWFAFLFAPLYFLMKARSLKSSQLPPLAFCLVLIFCVVHYSGVENWGVNFLFMSAWLILFKEENPA